MNIIYLPSTPCIFLKGAFCTIVIPLPPQWMADRCHSNTQVSVKKCFFCNPAWGPFHKLLTYKAYTHQHVEATKTIYVLHWGGINSKTFIYRFCSVHFFYFLLCVSAQIVTQPSKKTALTVKMFRPLETLAELFSHTSFSTFSISGVIFPHISLSLVFALSLPHLSCLSFVWVEVFVTVDEPVLFLSGLYLPASLHPPLFHPLGFAVSDLSESTDSCLFPADIHYRHWPNGRRNRDCPPLVCPCSFSFPTWTWKSITWWISSTTDRHYFPIMFSPQLTPSPTPPDPLGPLSRRKQGYVNSSLKSLKLNI